MKVSCTKRGILSYVPMLVFAAVFACASIVLVPIMADSCSVSNADKAYAATPKLSTKSKTMVVGDSFTLKVKNKGKKKVAWESSSKKVATVTNKGKVKARKAGVATISAKVGGRTLKCKVVVSISSSKAKARLLSYARKISWRNNLKSCYRKVLGNSDSLTFSDPQYAYTDLNKDGLPEMVVSLSDGMGWHHSYFLKCGPSGKVTQLQVANTSDPTFAEFGVVYSHGPLRLSSDKKTILFNPVRNSLGFGGVSVAKLSGSRISVKYDYSWERYSNSTQYYKNGKSINKNAFTKGTRYRALNFKKL